MARLEFTAYVDYPDSITQEEIIRLITDNMNYQDNREREDETRGEFGLRMINLDLRERARKQYEREKRQEAQEEAEQFTEQIQ